MKKIIIVLAVLLSLNLYAWNGDGGSAGGGGGAITAGIWTPDIPLDIMDI